MQAASHSSIAVMLIRLGGVICQAFTFVLLANYLDIVDMGVFAAVYVFWGLSRFIGPMGLDQIVMREISYARANNHPAFASGLCSYARRVAAGVGIATAVITAAVLISLGASTFHPLSLLDKVLIALAVPGFVLNGLQSAAVRGYGSNIAAQGVETLGNHCLTTLGILALAMVAKLTTTSAFFLFAACAWSTNAIYWAILKANVKGNAGNVAAVVKRRIWREGLEVWQVLLIIGIAIRGPTYISLFILGPAATAIFELAMRFGMLPGIFTTSVSQTFSPIAANLHAQDNQQALGEQLAVLSWLSFVPSACMLLVILIFGPWLLNTFFPPNYEQAFIPLLLLLLATTFHGAYALASNLFLMTGHQLIVRKYSVLRLVLVVLLGTAFCYLFGVVGMACAILLSTIVSDFGLALKVKPKLQVKGFLQPRGLKMLVRSLMLGALPTEANSRR